MKKCNTLTENIFLKYKENNISALQIAKEHNVTISTVYNYAKKFKIEFSRPYNNIIGLRSGKLLIIEKTNKRKNGGVVWKCLCDCGNEVFVRQDELVSKHTKSCGCLSKERPSRQLPEGTAAKNALYTNYIHGARRRNIPFELSRDDFISIAKMNCYYCGSPPNREYKPSISANGSFICNSIDRLNSNEGYNLENCVPACHTCNKMKMDFSEEAFLNKIKKIYEHKKLNKPPLERRVW